MKIGIVTIHFPYNYGAMLQAFALQKYLLDLNNDVEIIDYRPFSIDKVYHVYFKDIFKKPKKYLKYFVLRRTRYKSFEMFLKKYMRLSKRYTNENNIEYSNYDMLLVGSDQVWNYNIVGESLEYYTLNDVHNITKNAYASSFGISSIPNDLVYRYNGLKSFQNIGVREVDGVNLLKKMNIESSLVCDPTFLLSIEEWNLYCKPVKNITNNYVLLYSLANDLKTIETAEKIAKNYNMKVYTIHPLGQSYAINGKNLSKDYSIGPNEFIWLISNASFVCTNSFHAVVFSILYGKKFVPFFFHNTESRVKNLLNNFNIPSIGKIDEYDIFQTNDDSRNKIDELVISSKQFLKKITIGK